MKTMKYLFVVIAALLAVSCSLDRKPLTGPSSGTFPATAAEAQSGTLAVYKNISNNIHNHLPGWIYIECMTDISAGRTSNTVQDFKKSALTPTTSPIYSEYSSHYKTLGRLHLVLDNLDNLRGVLTDEEYYQYKAELLCLRGFCYDRLCQLWGDVPFIDHQLSLDDWQYARTPKEEVIERVITDMDDDLLEYLPVQWTKSTWGSCRIGRVAAFALKARICLNWGYYEEAAAASRKAMEYAEGVYELTSLDCTYYADHYSGEPDQTPLFGFAAETDSKEWIWSMSYSRLAASNIHDLIYYQASRVQAACSWSGPSLSMMQTFQCTDGLSIVESPLYNWEDPWANRDPRLDLYCLRHGARAMGVQFSIDPADATVYDYNAGIYLTNLDVTGNKSEYGPNGTTGPGGFLWRKFEDPSYYGTITGESYEDELDIPMIRYAELLLVDAEANIEWTGGDLSRAKSDIDRIRARVNMPEITGTTRAELRKALRYERKVELCDEGFRWFDLRRWKETDGNPIANHVLNTPQYAPAYGATLTNVKPSIDDSWCVTHDGVSTFDGKAFDARVHMTPKFVVGKDEVWPIPENEILTNDLMTQNPGY